MILTNNMTKPCTLFLVVDGSGGWIRTSDLLRCFSLTTDDIRKYLTHSKPQYRGPPLAAVGYSLLVEKGISWCVIARGVMLALLNISPPEMQWITALSSDTMVVKSEEKSTINLLPNQRLLAEWVINNRFDKKHIKSGTAVCYLVADAGTGKTHTGLEIVKHISGRTLILVTRLAIGKQWCAAAEDFLPNRPVIMFNEYTVKKRLEIVNSSAIIIATPSAALRFVNADWALYSLVIFDEVQQFCAPQWQCLLSAPVLRLLGLTATPSERPDTMDRVAYWRLGRPVHAKRLPGYDLHEVKFMGQVTFVPYTNPILKKKLTNANTYIARIGVLTIDTPRSLMIATNVIKLLNTPYKCIKNNTTSSPLMPGVVPEKHLNVLVFTERREGVIILVQAIASMMNSTNGLFGVWDENNCSHVLGLKGGATELDIQQALSGARVIVTTYSYSSVGVSFNHMNAMVLDSCRKAHFYQILRRIMRARSDTSIIRQYIHIIDKDFPQLLRRKHAHQLIYESIGVYSNNCAAVAPRIAEM